MKKLYHSILAGKLQNNRIVQHLAFWLLYLVLYTFNFGKPGNYETWFLITVFFLPLHLLFTYTQLIWAVPKYLLKGKIIPFIIFTLVLTRICVTLMWVIIIEMNTFIGTHGLFPENELSWNLIWKISPGIFKPVFCLFMICGLAVSIKLFKQWYHINHKQELLEKEKLQSELQLLKAQVHPHFLFNTLNNLYAYTLEKSDKAPEIVLKLSNLLRYILHECDTEKVPLEKEISILKDYIELEQLRYDERLEVSLTINGDLSNITIAPLLLLPFLENSFKHGTSEQIDQCWINIDIHIENNQLKFKLINSKPASEKAKNYIGGIGLQNVKKRLSLIYNDQYILKLIPEEDLFIVSLSITLDYAETLLSNILVKSAQPEIISKSHENAMLVSG